MQIFIEAGGGCKKIPEWGLLEFQGSFSSRDDGGPIFLEYLGDLNFSKDDIPLFISGHHILYGEQIKLHRPMAVIVKNSNPSHEEKYVVQAVIRKKIIFKTRPKPIIPSIELKNK